MQENDIKNGLKIPAHAYDSAVFEWHAPEYHKHPKGMAWFIVALIYSQEPKKMPIKISPMGIKIGDHYVPYSNIRAFWIVYHPPMIKTLNFRTVHPLLPDMMISLEHHNPAEIRDYLSTQVPEWEGKSESFSNTLVRLLRL
ncbi:MAG: hypothetical protein UY05_C0039G0006 [Candidatus Peregrinibacteria bacterium GW2011_GWA2_47_7]|nr:MAG: hypothetical protein UY05_C0039G0006 [Candidatus Peregrinibacteria bacterium GW2011_GWA2_47_7]